MVVSVCLGPFIPDRLLGSFEARDRARDIIYASILHPEPYVANTKLFRLRNNQIFWEDGLA